ncbi:hypothetical protein D0Y65_041718 [Glycine soja]|nr:hypothetical protein D0Y65_041718 [Glycine soja]
MQVVLTCFKSMTWIISNKNSSSSSKIAVINMKLEEISLCPDIRLTFMFSAENINNLGYFSYHIVFHLQDYGKGPLGETEVQFRVTRVTLEPMLRSMTYISQQLNAPVNRVAIINLRVCKLGS